MSLFPNRFAGRTAIITGGASGLGRDVARRIIAEGGRAALWDMNPETLAATAAEIGAVHTEAFDVADPNAVANASAYSATKAGVIGLTKSLGKELAQKNILVNAVTPATFVSPILSQMPQSQIDYMLSKIPMGRLGEVHETTALVCFLASEECSFSTAATFDTSGGRTTF